MTTSMIEQQEDKTASPVGIESYALPQNPSWLAGVRKAAMAHFAQLGFPTTSDENWRFTNIAPIRETVFALSDNGQEISRDDVDSASIPGLAGTQLVFVNGRFNRSLSRFATLPDGVKVLSLHEAFASEQAVVEKHFGSLADYQNQPFTAMNTALADDGVVVLVSAGKVVQEPIYVLNLATESDKPLLSIVRNLVIADRGASVTIVEDYVSLHDGVQLTNAVTEVFVGDNADVTHYLIERENTQAFSVSSLHTRQGRDSRLTSHSMLFGGAIVRNNVNPILDGAGSDSLLNGLYVIGGKQTVDNHMRVVHAKPHGDSRQYYKGIMNDHAKGVFRGRIVVESGAQKTDAKQSNQNLLLSPNASVNTDPQLEIYADDVKCTHGATIGQINQDQVFYLRSRGIPEETARAMIIFAFASENLDRMTQQPIRDFLRSQLLRRLPAGKLLEQSL